MTAPLTPDQPDFWRSRYQTDATPWDLGQAAPPFRSLLTDEKNLLPIQTGSVAVLGCGVGHDAALFAQQGFEVTGFDFAPEAIALATARYGQDVQFVEADIFNLPPQYDAAFDIVVEHTCFCAIRPQQRPDYVKAVLRLLKPNGYLIGLFWGHTQEGGPPYKTTLPELQTLFSPYFNFKTVTVPDNSVASRKGEEWLIVLQRQIDHL